MQLKNLDTHLTIDDFGTGYSSLAYLQKLPVDSLKIDQSFVTRMLTDDDDSAKIVRSIVELAHNLDLTVVAEGVENR
jgi:EAL domain-containing protein (putative c-di-GMP-specific phosphodiesterase class I)